MTTREAMTRGGQAHKIPDYRPEPLWNYLIDEFWKIKSGDVDKPIYQNDLDRNSLDRNERDIIISMDRAFRASLAKTRAGNDKYLASRQKSK